MVTVRFYPPAAKMLGLKDTEKTCTLALPYREKMTLESLHEDLLQRCPEYTFFSDRGRNYMENDVLTVIDSISVTCDIGSCYLKDGCIVEFIPIYQGG